MKLHASRTLRLAALALALAACGGSGEGSPATAARAWYEAISRLDLQAVARLTCAQERASVERSIEQLGPSGSETNLQTLKEVFQIDVSGVSYEERSVDGNAASVRITGVLKATASGQTQERTIDAEVPVVKEEGAWKVCAPGGPRN